MGPPVAVMRAHARSTRCWAVVTDEG